MLRDKIDNSTNKLESICIVAILKDEDPFLDEWIIYHIMKGIDHFYLYDNSDNFNLRDYLLPYREYVTVIKWDVKGTQNVNFNKQKAAYSDAVKNHISNFEWVIFLDGDEFIVIYDEKPIDQFLSQYHSVQAVSLCWHLFGHNGFYEDPTSLITTSLIRRKRSASRKVKTFTRTKFISEIKNSHYCELTSGDRTYSSKLKTGLKNDGTVAFINHYHCRSFTRWIKRAERGDAFYHKDACSEENLWRLTLEGCLKEFVSVVALDHNEMIDNYMVKYYEYIIEKIQEVNICRNNVTAIKLP